MNNLPFALENGLTKDEYVSIVKKLNREPNANEIGVIAAMWSEHCSYKSSKFYLKKLPTKGKHVIQGPGENAGIIDIGDNQCAVFKIESHNHPSFIEPYQGAATGVGGILRDVFTMGARPIALMNSLRFGNPKLKITKKLINGVVSGIAGYGNCMGIPTVGGEVYFDKSYNGNPLVNAFALGITTKDKIFLGRADGPGNPVYYLGAKTGKDGVKGAIMASDVFENEEELDKPTVQIGDPFKEKLLLEACLELFQNKGIIGIQDMGAAGLTSSASEMAFRSDNGIMLNLDKVPKRDSSINAYEMLLSESQERMLLVMKEKSSSKINKIFKKWHLDSTEIGEVIKEKNFIVKFKGKTVVNIPVSILTEDCPVYKRPVKSPKAIKLKDGKALKLKFSNKKLASLFKKIIKDENICSRRWVYEQFDYMVGTNTITEPGSDSAVIRIKNTKKALALTTNCNSGYCKLNPKKGSNIAVAECTRNIIASGAKPLAITNCLNFGNPEKKEIMWQFAKAIDGISEAVLEFNTPVISGNVSLYNENKSDSINPTPVISMVGLIKDIKNKRDQFYKNNGDSILLIGKIKNDYGGSIVSKYIKELKERYKEPSINLKDHLKINNFIMKINKKYKLESIHDISEGGLAVSLLESCFNNNLLKGAVIDLSSLNFQNNLQIFSESQGCYQISCKKEIAKKILGESKKDKIYVKEIGYVTENYFSIKDYFNVRIQDIYKLWSSSFPN